MSEALKLELTAFHLGVFLFSVLDQQPTVTLGSREAATDNKPWQAASPACLLQLLEQMVPKNTFNNFTSLGCSDPRHSQFRPGRNPLSSITVCNPGDDCGRFYPGWLCCCTVGDAM